VAFEETPGVDRVAEQREYEKQIQRLPDDDEE
jgi:hypothetical protein